MAEFRLPSPDDYAVAREWLREQFSFPVIRDRLERERGLLPATAVIVANDLAKELVQPLLVAKLPSETAVQRLVTRGLTPEEAAELVTRVSSSGKRNKTGRGRRSTEWGLWCGLSLMLLGATLAVGNVTGLAPTFSSSGKLCLLLGIMVAGGWRFFVQFLVRH